jgi:hypothetical protein
LVWLSLLQPMAARKRAAPAATRHVIRLEVYNTRV